MKNIIENIAMLLVLLLTLFMIYLVVQYNMVDEYEEIETISVGSTKKSKVDYLQSLEGYSDVDIQVDARKESMTNTVVIKSELNKDEIDNTVQDPEKSSYMQNLNEYSKEAQEENLDMLQPSDNSVQKPIKLEHEEIEDTIGTAIDALIEQE